MESLTKWGLALLICVLGTQALAAGEVSFPEDELPSETITPILDSKEAVKSRLVKMTGRFDVAVLSGWLLDEPFYNNQYLSFAGVYHFNETWGLGLQSLKFGSGGTSYSDQFRDSPQHLDFSRAPQVKSATGLLLQKYFLYGKVSWTKNTITPISAFFLADVLMADYSGKSLPWVNFGAGQKIFFTPKWGAEVSFKAMLRQQIDPLSQDLSLSATAPPASSFTTQWKIGEDLQLQLFYFF